jgi:ArsR family metal-binding transcriptional regulator
MLIDGYDLEVTTPPCEPGAERFVATARLRSSIDEALPYLNAVLPNAAYHRESQVLTWVEGPHAYAVRPLELGISNLRDRQDARKAIDALVMRINEVWERRDELTPDHELHEPPTPMTVYKLLPGINCKECGQPTCFTFALQLIAGQARVEACPPLFKPEYAEQLAQLQVMFGGAI